MGIEFMLRDTPPKPIEAAEKAKFLSDFFSGLKPLWRGIPPISRK
jgi:hypothetical protein